MKMVCHPERSEGSRFPNRLRFFALLRMTIRCLNIIIVLFLSFFVSSNALAKRVDVDYTAAKTCYESAKAEPLKSTDKTVWEKCTNLFAAVHKKYPKTAKAPAALYSAGRLRTELYDRLHRTSDVESAIKYYNQMVKEYPKSPLADDSLFQIGILRREPLKDYERAKVAFTYIIENYPDGDMAPKAKEQLSAIERETTFVVSDTEEEPTKAGPKSKALLTEISVMEASEETTVTLRLTQKATYSLEFTAEGKRLQTSPKLDFLLLYTGLGPSMEKEIPVPSNYLKKISLKKGFLTGAVRIIFEMAPNSTYKVAQQGKDIVLHFLPVGKKKSGKRADYSKKDRPFVVVVDPGHGGEEKGAVGPNGLKEKDVTLSVSRILANKLKKMGNIKVYLTRNSDRTLSLEERNAFAVSKKADFFISIHANASTNPKMSGIETYFLNNATDAAAAKLAKRENKTAGKKLSDVEHILSTMLQNYDASLSKELAESVQDSIVKGVKKKYGNVKNRNVRSAQFYVLVGAKCPAILVETAFISNPSEEKKLRSEDFQKTIANSITGGILKYIQTEKERMASL